MTKEKEEIMNQTNKVKRTGMIGLGAMGIQFARHMAKKGFDVAGYDINADAVRRAENDGIRHRGSPAEIGKHAEVVVVMVATDEQVDDVVERSGLLDTLAAGSVICIASSVAPETCQRLAALAAAKNIGVLDTPVVLGQEAADNGTCTVYVGGEEKWLHRARPVLETFGRDVLHVGDIGAGQITKMINNMLLWSTMVANFESLTLAKSMGMNIPKLVAALNKGSGANWSLSRWGKSTGKWAEKDMDHALELAQSAKVPMPLGGLVDQLVKGINQERMKALLG
jgi:3-hydroxyisobutyrate dehydrogenase-like beta-hydroxyacid dehydrogenase